jgi:hypothetical protein
MRIRRSRRLFVSTCSMTSSSGTAAFLKTGMETSPAASTLGVVGVPSGESVFSLSWLSTRVVGLRLKSSVTCTSCSTRPRRTAIMMTASSVSRKTMKKMGTLNRLFAMVPKGKGCQRKPRSPRPSLWRMAGAKVRPRLSDYQRSPSGGSTAVRKVRKTDDPGLLGSLFLCRVWAPRAFSAHDPHDSQVLRSRARFTLHSTSSRLRESGQMYCL